MLHKKSLYTIAKFNHLKDYYAVLNISKSCDQSAIKKAYYAIAKKCHPDINKGKEDQFKEVNEAYEVLSDEVTKKEYDQARTSGNSNFGTNNQYQNQRREQNYTNHSQNFNQKWSHQYSGAFEEAMRKAQQQFHKQQQQQYQQRRQSYEEQRREEEEEEEKARMREQEQYKNYTKQYEYEKKRKHFYSQQEREAYEQYLRQREFEEYQKEKYEEYKYKVQDISEGFQNIQKNWSSIKSNVGQIWNVFKGKKE